MKTGFYDRHYQAKSFQVIREEFSKGHKRVIIQLPTGAGKGYILSKIAYLTAIKNNKIIIVMRRRELILQTAKIIEKYTGLKVSVVMANTKQFDPENNIQVCSIDTITRRINKSEYQFLKSFGTILVDECHDATSPKYRSFLNEFPEAYWIGMTATCLPVGNKFLEDWDVAVPIISSAQLRDEGFLSPEITYAPAKIDVSGIKTRGGDYDIKSLAERASESVVIGDTVKTYQEYGENRPALLFAVNKEHSMLMAEAFRQAGIPAMHQDESHSSEERQVAIDKLKSGEIKILCSINIFSTGTDIPVVSCIIMVRPTKSEVLYVQAIGRGLRMYKKCARCKADCGAEDTCYRCGSTEFTDIKENCIILDHANNCERFGMIYDPREPKIRPPEKSRKKADPVEDMPKTKTCSACFAVFSMNELSCPLCGHTNETKKRMIEHEEGELRRVTANTLNISRFKKTLDKYRQKELRYNLKPAFKFFKLYEEHGDMIFDYSKELELPKWLKGVIAKQRVEQLKKEAQESIKKSSKFVYSK